MLLTLARGDTRRGTSVGKKDIVTHSPFIAILGRENRGFRQIRRLLTIKNTMF